MKCALKSSLKAAKNVSALQRDGGSDIVSLDAALVFTNTQEGRAILVPYQKGRFQHPLPP